MNTQFENRSRGVVAGMFLAVAGVAGWMASAIATADPQQAAQGRPHANHSQGLQRLQQMAMSTGTAGSGLCFVGLAFAALRRRDQVSSVEAKINAEMS